MTIKNDPENNYNDGHLNNENDHSSDDNNEKEMSFWRQFYKWYIAIPLIALLLASFLILFLFQEHFFGVLPDQDNLDIPLPELPEIIEPDYFDELKYGVTTLFEGVKIIIPKLNVEAKIIPPPEIYCLSTYNDLTKQGPVFLTGSVFPGAEGNVSVTAHRVGHGYYFKDLDFLKTDDEIILETPEFILTYKFVGSKIVNKYDWSLLNDHSVVRRLVLVTCDPKTTYQHTPDRLIVRAELDTIKKKE